ncbi:DUF6303 family protein [Streptomyces sp. NPDC087850]|uniref:DUF6303 family protein n=1 Tax=Streptomyces sp. NPDC087850 TaxID=3365809 RepID=UPI0037FFB458
MLTALLHVLPGSCWELFVTADGPVDEWPRTQLRGAAVPTMAARTRALARLGYVPAAPGAPWTWDEHDHYTERGPAALSAVTTVRPA